MKEGNLIVKSSPIALGIDIGGSHITTGIVDIEQKRLIQKSVRREFIDSNSSAESILNGWCNVINESFEGYNIEEKIIGIAIPGPFDYKHGISLIQDQDKFKLLFKLNLKEELAKRLKIPQDNLRFINDAAGFLQGEVFTGAAKGNANVMGLTLGTGLGSAFCTDGKAIDGALWNSSFLDGIAEEYLSTQWFIKRYQQLSGIAIKGVKELVSLVSTDPNATKVFMEFGNNLAKFLIPIIIKHKIETVIIGGNIAQAFAEFSPELTAMLKGNKLNITIKISELKENAALIGAASCWDLAYQHSTC
ncbi:ROK family protein [Pedobacter mucosus]|uniref:ROK family protein n=1 Tax=Pedobacter mucosus TaxID=2895286 RepID=UPI001EE456DD|nr:ROK family protein [Pedobacter mucosus]UKT62767.1 ROK family protein [Pedobacter mucosus]